MKLKSHHCHRPQLILARISVAGLLLLFLATAVAPPAHAEGPSVPARFVRDIKAPGYADVIVRPSAMHFDRFHDEILVGDAGKNRVLIFQPNGVYKFEFDLAEIVTSPRDITVDPAGYIYVIGSTPEGPAFQKFDFDGTPMTAFPVPAELEGRPVEIRFLACDDTGRIHALDHLGKRVLVYDTLGRLLRHYPLGADTSDQRTSLAAFGSPSFNNGDLLVPVGNAGTVYRYDSEGRQLGTYGIYGSKPGQLIFPVAVETSPEGIVMVLDRSRYSVVCYTEEGDFLGEWGGRGFRAGWFLGPFLLAAPSAEMAVVGQVFRSRIQVCALPRFIRDGNNDRTESSSEPVPDGEDLTTSHPNRKSINSLSASTTMLDVEFPSPELAAQKMREVTLSEVSQ